MKAYMMEIREKETGRVLNAITQSVNLNQDGKYYMRYLIGRDTYHSGFNCFFCIYNNDEFNSRFEVLGFVPRDCIDDDD